MAALREAVPDVELSLSDRAVDHRRRRAGRATSAIAGWSELPDCVSLNVAEEGWRELGELLAERGIWIELGLFLPAHAAEAAETGLLRRGAGARSSSRRRPRPRPR